MNSVVILGGGLAGMGAAYALSQAGVSDVTIVERGATLGGLAGSFEQDGHVYPLAYHHILRRDRTLLWFLERIGALASVRWRRVSMLVQHGGRLWDLGRPADFARFPLSVADKLRFVRLMARSAWKQDWGEWIDRSAAELVDAWAGSRVRETLFEPLTRLKFGLPCHQVSAAWLGVRLNYRESSTPLGYVPGANWTRVLCDGLSRLLAEAGVKVCVGRAVRRLRVDGDRIAAAELDDGAELGADAFVGALPLPVYRALAPTDATPWLQSVRYTAIVSAVCATTQPVACASYWLNLTELKTTACGLFRLDALNPTVGAAGEACLNFVTHVPDRADPFFARSDDELRAGYLADYRQLFGHELEPRWMKIFRLPWYSPVFERSFRNVPVRSSSWRNLFFAGNYRMFPSVASTGTALASGLECADALLAGTGRASGLAESVARFRLRAPQAA